MEKRRKKIKRKKEKEKGNSLEKTVKGREKERKRRKKIISGKLCQPAPQGLRESQTFGAFFPLSLPPFFLFYLRPKSLPDYERVRVKEGRNREEEGEREREGEMKGKKIE